MGKKEVCEMEKELITISPEKIFTLISLSGDAKSTLIQAYELVKQEEYIKADELLKEATQTLNGAHEVQTELITLEAQGKMAEVGILMVHAQDHLMNAILTKELIENMISMQKEINELKKK